MHSIYSILFLFLSFKQIETNQEITESNKQKVRACLKLQQKKFEENEELLNDFIKNKSEVYQRNPNKIILLALAYCYNKINYELSNQINKLKIHYINITRLGIKNIYDFENYDYDDQEKNKIIYENFIPTFEVVFNEITEKEDKKTSKYKFNIYFIHTKLFKFFICYTVINCIIIFHLRIKNKSKYIDQTDNIFDEDNKETIKNQEEEKENSNNNEKTGNNYRKLKKKSRLGKIKNN